MFKAIFKFCSMKFSIFFLVFFFANYSFSQSIKGKIVDKDNNPIEFAEIIVYQNNKSLISELTSNNGNFNVIINKNGNFNFVIRQFGEIFYQKSLFLNNDIDLGVIELDNSKKISEVVITAKKKLIEKKSDRLIYNVQSSVFANGISGDELLKNIPRIDPTSDGLKIIGKSNILVMIDDRILNI